MIPMLQRQTTGVAIDLVHRRTTGRPQGQERLWRYDSAATLEAFAEHSPYRTYVAEPRLPAGQTHTWFVYKGSSAHELARLPIKSIWPRDAGRFRNATTVPASFWMTETSSQPFDPWCGSRPPICAAVVATTVRYSHLVRSLTRSSSASQWSAGHARIVAGVERGGKIEWSRCGHSAPDPHRLQTTYAANSGKRFWKNRFPARGWGRWTRRGWGEWH